MQVQLAEEVKTKWAPIVESVDGKALSQHAKNNIARLLENSVQEGVIQDLSEVETTLAGSSGLDSSTPNSGGKWDPIVIAMVRRAMPQLVANELMGVQPMTGPTGLIFAMQPVYRTTAAGKTAGNPAFGGESVPPGYSGDGTTDADATGMATNTGEILGANEDVTVDNVPTTGTQTVSVEQTNPWNEMGFTISKTSVTAVTRALKAHYTDELAQDLKVIHGLDAEQELSGILTTEIIAEMNREMVGIIRAEARAGAVNTAVAGTLNLATGIDSDGRWEGEIFQYIAYQIQKECNAIALATRRGRGNIVITSADVVSALEYAGKLMPAIPGQNAVTAPSDVGVTMVGTMAGGTIKVFMDPYLASNEVVVGYKGSNQYDAGYFYCPYVPLQMYKARGEEDFQPRIGMKTRYGVVGHPQHSGAAANDYYRKFTISNL